MMLTEIGSLCKQAFTTGAVDYESFIYSDYSGNSRPAEEDAALLQPMPKMPCSNTTQLMGRPE